MTLSYPDIAVRQLNHALNLYLLRGDLVCAITLAGAAEEVLGRFAVLKGLEPALKRSARSKLAMFRALFPRHADPDEKAFVELSNSARNAMKHHLETHIKDLDLDGEAGRLLKRAIDNYALVFGSKSPKMRRFDSAHSA